MNQANAHNSFQEFYTDNHDALFRFCITKVRDRHIALDMVQESFITLWDYIVKHGDIQTLAYPRALLYRIARNSIIDWSRKKKTDSLDSILEAGIDFSEPESTIEGTMHQDDIRTVLQHIEALSDMYREVIIMRYIDGLAIHEIAELLGETDNVISVRIHRALEKLRSHINEHL